MFTVTLKWKGFLPGERVWALLSKGFFLQKDILNSPSVLNLCICKEVTNLIALTVKSGKSPTEPKRAESVESFDFTSRITLKFGSYKLSFSIKRKILTCLYCFFTPKVNLEKMFLAGSQSHLTYRFWYIFCFQKINIWHTYKGMKITAEWKQGREKIKTWHELLIWAMILSRTCFQTVTPQYLQFWTLHHCRKYLSLVAPSSPWCKIIIIVFSPRILSFSFFFFIL